MGCHHSKEVKEQVQDTTTTAPVAEQSSDLVVHSTETTVEVATETKAEDEKEKEEVVAEAQAEETETVEEAVKEEAAPVEEAVVEEQVKVEEPVVEAVKEEEVVEEAAVEEPKAEEEAPAVVEAVEEEPAVEDKEEEAEVAEPESEEEKPLVPEVTGAISFECAGVTFEERHVAFYSFKGTDKEDPAKEIVLKKRYNDFKALHGAMEKLMASEQNVSEEHADKFQTYPALPALPKAGLGSFVKGRRNQGMTDAREVQFKLILNAIARHPIAFQSAEFQAFLA